jgi:putative transposase
VIVAVAVNTYGRREVLGITVGVSEAEPFWIGFLRSLRQRGVKLVVSENAPRMLGLRQRPRI